MMRLREKVSIITGAGTGIGRTTSLMFAKKGAKVVAAGRWLEPIKEVAGLITSEGGEAIQHQKDVREVDRVKTLVERTVSMYERLDGIFADGGK